MPLLINFLPNVSVVNDVLSLQSIHNNKTFNRYNFYDQNNSLQLSNKQQAWISLANSFSAFSDKINNTITNGINSYTISYSKNGVAEASFTSDAAALTQSDFLLQKGQVLKGLPQSSTSSLLALSGIITINGQDITITESNTLEDIRDAINKSDYANVTASIYNNTLHLYSPNADATIQDPKGILKDLGFVQQPPLNTEQFKMRVESNAQDSATDALGLSGKIGINHRYIAVKTTDSLYDIRSKINNYSDIGVTGEINSRALSITSKTDSDFTLQDPDKIFKTLGIPSTTSTSAEAQTKNIVAKIEQVAQTHILQSDAQASRTSALGLTGSIGISGTFISVAITDSLTDIRDKINAARLGVASSFYGQALRLDANDAGTKNAITLQDPDNILHTLGFLQNDSFGNPQFKNEIQTAQDAIMKINNILYISSTNTAQYDNLKINFQTASPQTIQITLSPNVSSALSNITGFAEQYNSLISKINSYLTPNAPLFNDSALMMTRSSLNSILSKKFDGMPVYRDELNEIGISRNTGDIVTFTDAHLQNMKANLKKIENYTPQAIDGAVSNLRSLEQVGIISNDNGALSVDKPKLTSMLTQHFDDINTMLYDKNNGIISNLASTISDMLNATSGNVSFRNYVYAERKKYLKSMEYDKMIDTYTNLDTIYQKNKNLKLLFNFG